jgi:UDP-N-acetylmuramoyl-tripeptide--D-alanyl-D-alanine ligase
MRSLFRPLFLSILALLSRAIIRKYRPLVVMVTGSVGKTTTKDAVAAALSKSFHLRKSEKSFNSAIGVPLTIIGVQNPWSHPSRWIAVFGSALATIFLPTHYPKLLVLEVGADRPGDLAEILKIVRPDLTVVTLLPTVPVHVEAYETPEAVREEEFAPAFALPAGAPLIYNTDDEYASHYAEEGSATLFSFGTSSEALVSISDIEPWIEKGELKGMKAALSVSGKKHELTISGAIGRSQVFAPAAAVATGLALGLNVADILSGLTTYVPPPGRARIFKGKKGMLLIDDTYNSSPAAVEEILRSLAFVPHTGRTVAVLGDMLELGRYSVAEHARVGHIATEVVDVLVTVGLRARAIADAARRDGMAESSIYEFPTSLEAAAALEDILGEGDCVLVKGSQSIRMERIMRPFLAEYTDSKDLVRQEEEWQKR